MHVSLIRPPAYSVGLMGPQLVPVLGCAYIGAVTREAGYSVDIIDMCAEDISRTELIEGGHVAYGLSFASLEARLKPSDVIGFSCTFSQDWVFNKELIQYVHKICPEAVFVAGGEHITALPDYCLYDCPELDICVVGEGEEVFVQLLRVLERKGSLSEVPSLVYRPSQKEKDPYQKTKRINRIQDIDKLPLPAWDLIPMENYLSRKLNYHLERGRTIPMLASRGCPYNCTFCSNSNMWGAPWVARNPSLVVEEMQYYIDLYQANNFVFSDLTAVVKKEVIVELCNEIINRRIDVTWQLPTLRTEAVDYDLLKLMYKAGCRDVDFAIESGSKNVLLSVAKKNDPEKMFPLLKDGLAVGMNMTTNIVIGLPKEGFREFLSTYWLVIRLALVGVQELNAFPFVAYPGSKLFKDLLGDRKILLNDDYFLKLFGYTDLSKAISWSPHFGPRTLSFMRMVLLLSFYSLMFIAHPRRILRLIIDAARGRTTTKLTGVLKKVFKNIRAYRFNKLKNAR